MKQEIKIGQTDYSVLVFIPDAASTDGGGKTGLAHSDMTVSYTRVETDNDVTTSGAVSMADLASLTAAHSDWGWEEVDATNAPGLYRLDIADAVFATGAWSAVVYCMVTTSAAAATPMEFILVPDSPYVGVNVSMVGGETATPDSTLVDDVAAAVLASEGDTGVSLAKFIEMFAAFAAGKVSVSSAAGVSTYTYKKRDGTTTSFTAACSESSGSKGTRASTGGLS